MAPPSYAVPMPKIGSFSPKCGRYNSRALERDGGGYYGPEGAPPFYGQRPAFPHAAPEEPWVEQGRMCPHAEEEQCAEGWEEDSQGSYQAPPVRRNIARQLLQELGMPQWPADQFGMLSASQVGNVASETTLLIRNVSRRILQEHVLRYWPSTTWGYDMLYVVYDLKKKRGAGRVYINFLTKENADHFYEQWHDRPSPVVSSTDKWTGEMRPLKIEAGKRQGLLANVDHWQGTLRRDFNQDLAPALFDMGVRLDFWSFGQGPPMGAQNTPQMLGLLSL